jgi:hypothetical protein
LIIDPATKKQGRYGQVVLSAPGRILHPRHRRDPLFTHHRQPAAAQPVAVTVNLAISPTSMAIVASSVVGEATTAFKTESDNRRCH